MISPQPPEIVKPAEKPNPAIYPEINKKFVEDDEHTVEKTCLHG